MIEINKSIIIIICVATVVGFLYCFINCKKTTEAMATMSSMGKQCPNVLIQDGSGIYLKNNTLADIPGINPIKFNNLEEYVEFYNWQKSQGIDCPVLFLQKTYNAQSDPVFKFRPDIFNPEGGLNSNTMIIIHNCYLILIAIIRPIIMIHIRDLIQNQYRRSYTT